MMSEHHTGLSPHKVPKNLLLLAVKSEQDVISLVEQLKLSVPSLE